MLAHQLAGLDGHAEIAANVHVDGFLEGRYVSVQHMAELRVGGGVVDQDVEAAELLADLREYRLNLLQLATWQATGWPFRQPRRWRRLPPGNLRSCGWTRLRGAPCWAQFCDRLPIPRLAPETKAILPSRSNRVVLTWSFLFLVRFCGRPQTDWVASELRLPITCSAFAPAACSCE